MHARKPFSTESTRVRSVDLKVTEADDERNPSQDSTSKQGLNVNDHLR